MAQSKVFENEYIRAEIPEKWECQRQNNDWACWETNKVSLGEASAAIVVSAKAIGPNESLEYFEEMLSEPRAPIQGYEPDSLSEVLDVRKRNINTQWWVEAVHYNSEIQDYLTHYLVTVRQGLVILTSFSVHENKYEFFIEDIERYSESLEIIATPELLNPPTIIDQVIPKTAESYEALSQKSRPTPFQLIILSLSGLIVLGLLVYAFKK